MGTYKAITIPADSRLFADAAAKYGLPLTLVLAIVEHESSFQQGAVNPEPHWIYLWDVIAAKPFRRITPEEAASEKPPADFRAMRGVPDDAEWWFQQIGLGLMQVQGGVARELGFDGPWLSDILIDPVLAVDLGCRHLRNKVRRYAKDDDLTPAIVSFNTGSPRWSKDASGREVLYRQEYADTVLAIMARRRAELGGA